MDEWISLIIEMQGIIGAVLGVIATLITTQILRSIGKINVEILDIDVRFKKDSRWSEGETTSQDDAEYIELDFKLKCYNSSETPQTLDNIIVSFLSLHKEKLYTGRLKDFSTAETSYGSSPSFEDLIFINVMPKQMDMKSVHITTEKIEVSKVKYIELSYKDKRNKEKRIIEL